jgi:hypothetical protein
VHFRSIPSHTLGRYLPTELLVGVKTIKWKSISRNKISINTTLLEGLWARFCNWLSQKELWEQKGLPRRQGSIPQSRLIKRFLGLLLISPMLHCLCTGAIDGIVTWLTPWLATFYDLIRSSHSLQLLAEQLLWQWIVQTIQPPRLQSTGNSSMNNRAYGVTICWSFTTISHTFPMLYKRYYGIKKFNR